LPPIGLQQPLLGAFKRWISKCSPAALRMKMSALILKGSDVGIGIYVLVS
jgi:hypothetical protein